jgi:hypothetical protein
VKRIALLQIDALHCRSAHPIKLGYLLSPLPILRSYEDQRVLDGTQWELAIDYGIKKISTSGSNSYPGTNNVDMLLDWEDTPVFDDFLHAFNLLLGGTKIQ